MGNNLEVGVVIDRSEKELDSVKWTDAVYPLRSEGPLVIGYGAARHVGHANLAGVAERDATNWLFFDRSTSTMRRRS